MAKQVLTKSVGDDLQDGVELHPPAVEQDL